MFVAAVVHAARPTRAFCDEPPVYREHQDLHYYLDERGHRHPIHTVADWEIRRAHILAHLQEVMGPLPRPSHPVRLEVRTLETVSLGPIVRRKIDYHTDSSARRVAAYLFVPAKPARRQPA